MSVVLCLPAHLCVSPAASRGRPPTGTRQKRFTAAGLPISRVPLGATNPEQRGAAARSSQLAAQRSGSQRRPATALSSSRSRQRRPEHRPDRAATVKEVHRPGLLHQRVPSADQQGRANHLHNHQLTSTSRTPSPVLQHPPQQTPQDQFVERNECTPRTSRPSMPPRCHGKLARSG